MVTGDRIEDLDDVPRGFQAAHIYPRYGLGQWKEFNYGCWLNNYNPADADLGIDSIQNGMLLRADVHLMWDAYNISVNINVSGRV